MPCNCRQEDTPGSKRSAVVLNIYSEFHTAVY